MKPQYESVSSPRNSFLAFRRAARSFRFKWHYHPEYELTLIERGSGQRFVGDNICDYHPGDLVLLGPNLPHTWKSENSPSDEGAQHCAIVLQFRIEHLGAGLLDLDAMRPVALLLENAVRGLQFHPEGLPLAFHQELTELLVMPAGRRMIGLLSILLTLAETQSVSTLSSGTLKPPCRISDERRMNKICTFLNRNLEQGVNYAALAKYVHMNQSSLCRFFKRATGRTITEYVNEIRISNAARLLIETDRSTLDIALAVGFSNYSNFCRQFKKRRACNPLSLRQTFRAAST